MASSVAEMMLQCVFNGSISMSDAKIERRPYHRNCSCAMHKSKGASSKACEQPRKIAFPKKQPQNGCSLSTSSSQTISSYCFLSEAPCRNRGRMNKASTQR